MKAMELDHVYYWTTDIDRSVKFYEDVVGLRLIRRDDGNWALFEAGPVHLALHGAIEGRPFQPGGATAVFRVDDLDAARVAIEARGAEFDEHVGEVQGFARFASFHDPDGNVVQIIEYVGGLRGGSSPSEDEMSVANSERTPRDEGGD